VVEHRAEALIEPLGEEGARPMNTSSQPPTRRTTWIAADGTAWRIERIADRWQLSRWLPVTEQWLRVGSHSSRSAAVDAAQSSD
jgi:hypothetical protein